MAEQVLVLDALADKLNDLYHNPETAEQRLTEIHEEIERAALQITGFHSVADVIRLEDFAEAHPRTMLYWNTVSLMTAQVMSRAASKLAYWGKRP